MDEARLYQLLVWAVVALGAVTAVALRFVVAPYGRHARDGWGPSIDNRIGWMLMEAPAVWWFAWVYFQGTHATELAPLLMLGLWQLHYLHRALYFPLRLRTTGKRMPVLVMLLGMGFQFLNAWLNARAISSLHSYPEGWPLDPRFLLGSLIFGAGYAINLHADYTLIGMRRDGDGGYQIPRGGMFRFISCPNYLGELLEWVGWALLCWTAAGLAFALYTAANLVPRALSHHSWYRERFPDYPPERRAVLPGLL